MTKIVVDTFVPARLKKLSKIECEKCMDGDSRVVKVDRLPTILTIGDMSQK
jgi:hypothetical protein